MNEPTMEALARRLDRVERENRRMKQAGAVVLAMISAVVLMGQVPPNKVVDAEVIILRDAKGKPRGGLFVNSDGLVALALSDMDGITRAEVGVRADGTTHLLFRDKTSKPRVILRHREDATAFFFADKGDRPRALLSLEADDSLSLNLYDHGVLNFWDKAGKNRLVLGVSGDGSPALRLIDKAGVVRADLGSTSLKMKRTGEVVQRPESSLVLFDDAGKVVWSAP